MSIIAKVLSIDGERLHSHKIFTLELVPASHQLMELSPEENVSLNPFTTFRIGGKARYFARITHIEELKAVPIFLKREGLPVFILGGGSNILLDDEGFPGLVLKIELKGKEWNEKSETVRVAAGENWDDLVKESIDKKFFGIENLSGIPGTVGGAVIQNIGAYGAELSDTLEKVEALDLESGMMKTLSKEDCQLSYRHSFFKTKEAEKLVITAVSLKLNFQAKPRLHYRDLKDFFQDQPTPALSAIRQAVIEIRKKKFPPLEKVGTAGSFFKNPIIEAKKYQELLIKYPEMPSFSVDDERVKVSAAWLLDKVGNFRGRREGNVGSFENQALVVVNFGHASAKEIKNFTDQMKKNILEKIGIQLEEEVKIL